MPRKGRDIPDYKILRDKREKARYWTFPNTEDAHLVTGDYTIANLEDVFIIERKASTGELSNNITKKQFEAELKRMQKFKHAYIICEFTLEDVFNFPYNSSIPKYLWRKLRVTSHFILSRIAEIEAKYKVKFIFAGPKGKEYCEIIFKRMARTYADRLVTNDPA